MKTVIIAYCCLALALANSLHKDTGHHPERSDQKTHHPDHGIHGGGHRNGNGIGTSIHFGKRDTTVHGHAEHDKQGTHAGAGVEHSSNDGNTHTEAHVEHSSNGGTSYGGSFSHTFGKRDLHDGSKRDTSVHGHADHDKDGNHVGAGISHSSKDGNTHVGADVEHSTHGGTSYGVSGSHTWSHSGGSKTTVSGGFSHGSHGNSGGISVTHTFGRRLADLEEAVRDIQTRDTTVHGHAEHHKQGTHAGAGVEHSSKDGNTHTEAHVEHSSNGGTSYGGSFSHTFGKRNLENSLVDVLKRDTSVHGHADHDKDGNHVGTGISHSSKDGNTHVGADVEHSTHGGTSYGVSGSHTWSHSGGSKTTVSGGFSHGSHGNSGGVSVTHTFGRRLTDLEEAVREIQTRDTTVHGHAEHDKQGTHAGAGVEHSSKDGNTHSEAHVEHNSNGGTSYGGSFSHSFGKRDLENSLVNVLKRDTSVHGHADHDKDGTHVGAGISHSSKDGNTHVGADVEHSTHGGTSYGVSGSHTWSHSGGSKTTVSGGFSHGSHGNSGGVSVTHTFGRRLADLEEAVRDIQTRDTTVHGHAEHDKQGTHAGAGVEHSSKDGNTHTEAHVEHSSNGGTSYGGSFSHSFGKRDLENSLVDVLKRDTSVHGHADHDKDGTHVGAGISHSSKDGNTHVGADVEHSTHGGTSYGVSGSHTWSHSGGSKTTVSGGFSHGSHGNSGGVSVTHTFGRRLADLEEAVRDIQTRDTTVHGHAEHDKQGTHAGAGVEHSSKDGNTHTEAHVEHSSNGGTSYGGSFSHSFGKRDLENSLVDVLKRDTSVHGHADHDKDGTHVGAGISHSSKDGNTHVGADVEHSTHGGTSYGVSGSHTWSHSGGSKTTVSGGFSHGSHGNSGGVSVTHTFGRRLADLEEAVRDIQTRETTVHGHAEHDKQGTHAGAGVEHSSKDGNTHTEAHVELSSNGGTSYGGSFSHSFGRRMITT